MRLCDILEEPARRYANGTALHHGAARISFRRLRDDVILFAGRLSAAGVRPGDVVAVHAQRAAAHWVLLLALMRVGAVSVSLTNRHEAELRALPDLSAVAHLGESPAFSIGAARPIPVDSSWAKPLEDAVELPGPDEAERHVGRIAFTSGVTGTPKAILLDPATLARRLSGTAARTKIHTRSVLWCGLGPDTAYGFTAPVATWMAGASMCLSANHAELYDELMRGDVNLIVASPMALEGVLKTIPATARQRLEGQAIVAGGRLSAKLREELLARLCSEVKIAYGSSETGGVASADAGVLDRHPGAVGSIEPDVRLEIVDETGAPVPRGRQGRVRVATDNAVSSYLGDETATAAHFSEGWFYPGDIGVLSEDDELTILGRSVDVLNIGGAKLSAQDIESFALGREGIRDACAVMIGSPGEGARLAIAAAGVAEAVRALSPALRSAMPGLPRFAVVPVSRIPRLAAGKVNREEFGRLLALRLREPASAEASDGFALLPPAEADDSPR